MAAIRLREWFLFNEVAIDVSYWAVCVFMGNGIMSQTGTKYSSFIRHVKSHVGRTVFVTGRRHR